MSTEGFEIGLRRTRYNPTTVVSFKHLVIMDVSSLKYFKKQHCQKYLDIIKNIIDLKIGTPSWI